MKNLSLTLLALLFCFAAFAQTPAPITGPTSVCTGSTALLSDVTPGGTWSSSNTSVAIVGSTSGVITTIAAGSVTITYTIPTGFVTLGFTVYPLPNVYSLTGGGTYCFGGSGTHIVLNGSEIAASYQLYESGAYTGIMLAGTGAALDFGAMTTAGIYTVTAVLGTTGCITNMSGSATVSVSALPNVYMLIGGGTLCAGGAGFHITLSNSDFGVNYQLYNAGIATGSPVAGTGGVIDFGIFTTPGTYTAVATNTVTYCSNNMIGSATITVSPLPTVHLVTGGGGYCSGGTGVHIGLMSSAVGVSYQLYNGSVPVGSPLAGTGSALDFGLQTVVGIYTVKATNIATGCNTIMTGTATVFINPLPVSTYSVTGGGSFCAGGAGLHVGLSGSDTGVSYQLFVGPSAVGLAMAGTGSSLDFGLQIFAGPYAVIGTTSAGCIAGMTGSVTITVNPTPAIDSVTGGGSYCAGGTGYHVYLNGSTAGVDYQLMSGGTPTGSAVPGTGSSLDFGLISTAGTYTVDAANSTTGCTASMTGLATITVNPLPTVTASATSACGGIYTLAAGGAATYSWAPAIGLSCSTCSSATSTPTVSATYTVTGTDAVGCTNSATASVDGNRISGQIAIAGSSPSLKVWLIQFNPSDSSITSLDSTMACTSGGSSYYEFMDKVPGNYMVKAQLTTSVPGTSDYIPTYSTSTPNWYAAATVAHTTTTDNLDINMIYGTVPSGPGFISGYVYAGAGRGTTGDAPVEGMLVYLKDPVTGLIMTYTYTDATGAYFFSGLAFGNYTIYPENFNSNTIPSSVIVLSTEAPVATGLNFRQYTDSKVIKPIVTTGVPPICTSTQVSVFPNPTNGILTFSWSGQKVGNATIVITDMVGRTVHTEKMQISTTSGENMIDLSSLKSGIYFININSGSINFSSKISIIK